MKRIIAALIGIAYAAAYWFWTMLITGGGHANFIWVFLFFFVEFAGIYFPLMAVLAVDLSSRLVKIVFGSLIAFNVIGSSLMILAWITGATGDSLDDFSTTISIIGVGSFLFSTFLHFLPTLAFSVMLYRSIFSRTKSDEVDLKSLNLS